MMRAIPSDYCSLLNQLMLDNQPDRDGSHPSIDRDYDPWKINETDNSNTTTNPFTTTPSSSEPVFNQSILPINYPSSEILSHDSSLLGFYTNGAFSSPALRSRFSSVDEIQPNWPYTVNSVTERTVDHPRQFFEENLQSVLGPEIYPDLSLHAISNQSAVNCLDFTPDPETLRSFEELFGSNLSQGASSQNVQSEEYNLIRSCSSCGILKPHLELSHLRPCLHPHCNTCMNTLINSSCNDPPPPQMVCFLCSQPVTGFDLPIAFEALQNDLHLPLWAKVSSTSSAESFQTGLNGFDFLNLRSPSSDLFGIHLSPFGSGRSPALSDEFIPESPLSFSTSDSGNSSPWPIVRVDNISWSLTVTEILKWLPGGSKCLPPPELCPLPIHILCHPADGKTLNHCFIEVRNLPAAHFLVRHRHGTKIGGRPCSVVLTSPSELYSKILGVKTEDENPHDVMKSIQLILKLCVPHNASSIKAPERAFFHLMSLLSHYEHMLEGKAYSSLPNDETAVVKNWTETLQIAIETLLSCKNDIKESSKILRVMVDVGISSPLIDNAALFQFLSQVESFFNQISKMRT